MTTRIISDRVQPGCTFGELKPGDFFVVLRDEKAAGRYSYRLKTHDFGGTCWVEVLTGWKGFSRDEEFVTPLDAELKFTPREVE